MKFIEGRRDLSSGRRANDARTAESSALSKHFKTVAYSPDGTCVLAGGHSKYVCLYAAASGSLLGKFELSMNRYSNFYIYFDCLILEMINLLLFD